MPLTPILAASLVLPLVSMDSGSSSRFRRVSLIHNFPSSKCNLCISSWDWKWYKSRDSWFLYPLLHPLLAAGYGSDHCPSYFYQRERRKNGVDAVHLSQAHVGRLERVNRRQDPVDKPVHGGDDSDTIALSKKSEDGWPANASVAP